MNKNQRQNPTARKEVITAREFIRHYMEPFLVGSPDGSDDPRPEMIELLKAGKEDEVIQRHDPDTERLPSDPRALLHLVNAYLQRGDPGDVARAKTLCEVAIDYFARRGECERQATAIAQRARVAWREEGVDAAMALLWRAINEVDSENETAWGNVFCYLSASRRGDLLEDAVGKFETTVPDWFTRPFFIRHYREDAMLSWARGQASFAPIMQRLSEVNQKNA